ncbi:expressed unknown protein [Seminavis robusta]|uniref:Uncharacterized protein n=1 Tax=Seminavis robusta TaxID=568900 RepID=A0A9N8I1H0_9STRA|nr:expressed unknown protein [Seminavis robusta]|eukprot:Sro3601_g349560.1 n/a (353) ;mRNA; f:1627-2685
MEPSKSIRKLLFRSEPLVSCASSSTPPNFHNSDPSMSFHDALEFSARSEERGVKLEQPSHERRNRSLRVEDVFEGVDESVLCFCRSNSFSILEPPGGTGGGVSLHNLEDLVAPPLLRESAGGAESSPDDDSSPKSVPTARKSLWDSMGKNTMRLKTTTRAASERDSSTSSSEGDDSSSDSTSTSSGDNDNDSSTSSSESTLSCDDDESIELFVESAPRRGVARAKSEQKPRTRRPGLARGSSLAVLSIMRCSLSKGSNHDDGAKHKKPSVPKTRGVSRTKSAGALWRSVGSLGFFQGNDDEQDDDKTETEGTTITEKPEFRWDTMRLPIQCHDDQDPTHNEKDQAPIGVLVG